MNPNFHYTIMSSIIEHLIMLILTYTASSSKAKRHGDKLLFGSCGRIVVSIKPLRVEFIGFIPVLFWPSHSIMEEQYIILQKDTLHCICWLWGLVPWQFQILKLFPLFQVDSPKGLTWVALKYTEDHVFVCKRAY